MKHSRPISTQPDECPERSDLGFEPHIPKSVRAEITRVIDAALARGEADRSLKPSDDPQFRSVAEWFHFDADEMFAYVLSRRRYFGSPSGSSRRAGSL